VIHEHHTFICHLVDVWRVEFEGVKAAVLIKFSQITITQIIDEDVNDIGCGRWRYVVEEVFCRKKKQGCKNVHEKSFHISLDLEMKKFSHPLEFVSLLLW